jgi:hypothetical protein
MSAPEPAAPGTVRLPLSALASTRSGDKGADANVGVWTDGDAVYAFLRDALTADRVRTHLAALVRGEVVRYELPTLRALNFVLHDALDGGGTVSLRTDAQGKTLSHALGRLLLDVPAHLTPDPARTSPRHDRRP